MEQLYTFENIEETRTYLKEVYTRSQEFGIESVVVNGFVYKVEDDKIILLDYEGENVEKLVVLDWFDELNSRSEAVGKNIKEVEFGEHLKVIGAYGMNTWYHLRKITAPGIEVVKDYAFYNNGNLQEVVMINLRHIGSNAFDACTGLSSITLEKVEVLEFRALADTGLISVNLPALKQCGGQALSDNRRLTKVKLPSHRFRPGYAMMTNCYRLSEVINSEVMEEIQPDTFRQCRNLHHMNLRARSIAPSAFNGCANLQTVRLYNNIVYVSQTALQRLNMDVPSNRKLPVAEFRERIQRERKTLYQKHIENIKKGRYL